MASKNMKVKESGTGFDILSNDGLLLGMVSGRQRTPIAHTRALAHQFAASGEMKAALETALDRFEDSQPDKGSATDQAIKKVRAALSKADAGKVK